MAVQNTVLETYKYEAFISVLLDGSKEMYLVELIENLIDEHDRDDIRMCFHKECGSMAEAHSELLKNIKIELATKLNHISLRGKWAQEQLDTLNSFEL